MSCARRELTCQSRPRHSARANYQDTGASQMKALLQWSYDAADIGIEAVQFAVEAANHGIARADLAGQRVGILQLFLQRQRFEGQQVRPSQIADVDVIADAGAVACGIVRSENVDMFGAAESDL